MKSGGGDQTEETARAQRGGSGVSQRIKRTLISANNPLPDTGNKQTGDGSKNVKEEWTITLRECRRGGRREFFAWV